jgi:hypothetical protein
MSYPDLQVEVDGDLIIVSAPETQFIAIYARPSTMRQLILRKRTEGDDYELFARGWQTANDKARELGWFSRACRASQKSPSRRDRWRR